MGGCGVGERDVSGCGVGECGVGGCGVGGCGVSGCGVSGCVSVLLCQHHCQFLKLTTVSTAVNAQS